MKSNNLLQQAITAHQNGKLDEAENLYHEILKTEPKHPDANHNLGLISASLNKPTETLKLFKTATEENPNKEQFWISYTNELIKENKLNEAEVACRKAIEINPSISDIYFSLGIIMHILSKLEEAEISFKKAIELKPNYVVAHYNLGITLQSLSKFDEAEIIYNKAIKLKPDYVEAHYNLGITLQSLSKFDEAEIIYNKAIELKPDFAEAYNNLGITLHTNDKLEKAEISYNKAIKFKPDFAEAYSNLGNILRDLKNFEKAEISYNKAIELKTDYAAPYVNLATILRTKGKLKEAEVCVSSGIKIEPSSEAYINRGHILFDKGEYELALKDYDIANTKDSRGKSLECLYALGQIEEIYQRINLESEIDKKNLHVAAFSSFISYKEKKSTSYDFCTNPMDFIIFSNLSSHINDSNLFIDEVIEELQKIKTRWEPDGKATVKGFQSNFNILKNPQEKMSKLKSIIENELDAYYLKFKDENCSFIKSWPKQKYLACWHVFLKKQGFQESHIHPAGWLSGVIYLKVVPPLKKNEGAIEFSLNGEHYFDKNSPKLIHEPKAGDIVLFPSSLHHKTIPFTTDTDRIIVSFDLAQ